MPLDIDTIERPSLFCQNEHPSYRARTARLLVFNAPELIYLRATWMNLGTQQSSPLALAETSVTMWE